MSESMRELIKKRSKIDYRSLLLGVPSSVFPPNREVKTVATMSTPSHGPMHHAAGTFFPIGVPQCARWELGEAKGNDDGLTDKRIHKICAEIRPRIQPAFSNSLL